MSLRRYKEARIALEESAALNIAVSDRRGLGVAYRGLGVVAQAQGKHPQAVVMFCKSLDTFTELGGNWWVARVLAEMGRSVFSLGNTAEAGSVWHKSLRLATETRATPVGLAALIGLASVLAKQDHKEVTLVLVFIVLNHPANFQETREWAGQLGAEIERHLTSQQVSKAQARAQNTTFETA